ncbi:1,4-dihydroxy-2-naphthoate octaprenyltransferase [Clostridium estertheticum]|uniref:1,4-dihydroxy-2-naphthoate octaprenyltransferase n=1 Tax=Clostridium estertheticum subsp. estertheticum TaxID=1552 RepID=A0A1J0GCK5_9CLOT|nr:1,4-dihydroxy-2-naphthoate octaprenyltransferase [Clostridium estertheticum]APC39019.1 1,4-dihydroxy-2-naphthoate octaprenyltransferase [Clostridium estertheticum subsp. estertheticum]MBU3173745.1 1,4-dihydroxy-2-naphthoate octaprenyltransferase [Clostridium estertheticum]MBZ9615023.1 1,4-dihydroxy-2-naphthoate octaprenyltransferase [Clostridium estertheticum subsp. laramiense]WAG74926.1 1,4-dihydroxy-2-naphthoate octaprenyltransferase [Clostridium estertheticum]
MISGNVKTWLRAIRPFSFTGSVIPVTIGAILAIKHNNFQFGYFILSIVAILLLHTSVNLLSDHDDYENKVDTKDSYGSSGVILENLLSSKQIFRCGILCLILGSLIGLFLSYEKGVFILILGLIGALGGYSYTGKPLMLKYKGLGAPLVFLLFGPLMVIGSYYVQTKCISAAVILISIPVGLLTTAILHANDIRDIHHDKNAGIKTLSMLVGKNNAKKLYYGMLILSYVSLIIMIFFGVLPLPSLLCLITLPIAFSNSKTLYNSNVSVSGLITLDKSTGKLQAQFGILLIFSILLNFLL